MITSLYYTLNYYLAEFYKHPDWGVFVFGCIELFALKCYSSSALIESM